MRRASKPAGKGPKRLKDRCGQTNIVVTSGTPDSLTVDWKALKSPNSGRVTGIAGAGLRGSVLSLLLGH